ncbi:MAG: hypothetical protein U0528_15960 [Anaerolineae bacterium]
MRGKITVIVVLLIGVAVFAYGLYFTAGISPVDQRFDQRRDPLPVEVSAEFMFPPRIGDFLPEKIEPMVLNSDGVYHAGARYLELQTRPVEIEATQIDPATGQAALETLIATFRQDQTVGRLTSHFDARVPYFYVAHAINGRPVYSFYWVNGSWLFHAYADQADDETVLRFVNVYPF